MNRKRKCMFNSHQSEQRKNNINDYEPSSKRLIPNTKPNTNFIYTNIVSEGNNPITRKVTSSKDDDKGVYCFWTNKGGVGKTTTVIHLSLMLSKNKKKTIVIDFDPQLNSTMFFQTNINQEEELYDNHNKVTIRKVLESCFANQNFSNVLNQSIVNVNENLDFIRGDLNIFNLERDIHLAETTVLSMPLRLVVLSSFKRLFEELRKRYDFVVLDLNPSSSVLNQLIICSSDYLIMPITADVYCEYSINFVFENILLWKKRFNGHFRENKREDIGNVKIKGVSFNMFRIYNGKLPVVFQNKYDTISKQLVERFTIDNGENTHIRNYNRETDIVLGKIKQFDQLVPIHNEKGIAIWEITKEVLKELNISSYQNYLDQVNLYEKEISTFCHNVFKK